MISAAEEELARRIRKGDEDALQELTDPICVSLSRCKTVSESRSTSLNLISEGNIGLMHAASKFDETRGFKFISYAVWWMDKALLLPLQAKPGLCGPQNKVSALGKMNKSINKLNNI